MAAYHYPVTSRRIPNINRESDLLRIVEKVRSLAQDSWNAGIQSFTVFGKKFDIVIIDRQNAHVECAGKDCGVRIVRGIAELDRR